METINKFIEGIATIYGFLRLFHWWIRKSRLEVRLAKMEYQMQHKHIVNRIRR